MCKRSCWAAAEWVNDGDGVAAVAAAEVEAIVSASTDQSANALVKVVATGTGTLGVADDRNWRDFRLEHAAYCWLHGFEAVVAVVVAAAEGFGSRTKCNPPGNCACETAAAAAHSAGN